MRHQQRILAGISEETGTAKWGRRQFVSNCVPLGPVNGVTASPGAACRPKCRLESQTFRRVACCQTVLSKLNRTIAIRRNALSSCSLCLRRIEIVQPLLSRLLPNEQLAVRVEPAHGAGWG